MSSHAALAQSRNLCLLDMALAGILRKLSLSSRAAAAAGAHVPVRFEPGPVRPYARSGESGPYRRSDGTALPVTLA